MSRARRVAAPVLAAALTVTTPAGAQTSGVGSTPPGLPTVPVTKVIAIGRVTERWTPEAIRTVMPREVRETVELYLEGRIDQWYARKDQPGVVLVFNPGNPKEVHELLEALPLGREGMMTFELIPIGPLAPLGLLASGSVPEKAKAH